MFKIIQSVLCGAILLFLSACSHKGSDTSGVKSLANEFSTAWNQHNSQELAGLWTADGDFLSPWNQTELIKGHEALEKYFSDEYRANMKASSIELNVDRVRMIDPDTAFVEANFTITGMSIAGVPAVPFHNNAVFLLVKQDGKWKIQIARPY